MNPALVKAREKIRKQTELDLSLPKRELKFDPSILFHPNIPKPLHTVNPRSIKGQAWWDEVRQKAYKEMDYHCHACGVLKHNAKINQWLEAHEMYDINYETGAVTLNKIVALCTPCHMYIHSGLANVKLGNGQLSQEDYDMIREHGDHLLADIEPPLPPELNKVARWEDWHLIFEGKKYYSPFEDYSAWENHWDQ